MHWYADVLRRYMDLRWLGIRGVDEEPVSRRARTSSQEPPGTARLPRRADVREDASVRLAVDVDRLLFFDWQSGRAIR